MLLLLVAAILGLLVLMALGSFIGTVLQGVGTLIVLAVWIIVTILKGMGSICRAFAGKGVEPVAIEPVEGQPRKRVTLW